MLFLERTSQDGLVDVDDSRTGHTQVKGADGSRGNNNSLEQIKWSADVVSNRQPDEIGVGEAGDSVFGLVVVLYCFQFINYPDLCVCEGLAIGKLHP